MFKLFLIAMLLTPYATAISVNLDMSTPDGAGVATGYTLDRCRSSHINTILAPAQGYLEETGSCQGGDCASWISYQMRLFDGITSFWQDFSAHNRDTSWWYGVGNGMIGTSVAIK